MLQTISVKQLNTYVKSLLESDPRLLFCSICGEITNFKKHFSSGHIYFTLCDGVASIKCVMFKGNALKNQFELKDGLAVVCTGKVSIYDKDGTYQLYVETCVPDGLGNKLLALQQLKEKLLKEGLFDEQSKRKIPIFPKRVAVVTSGTGAALQDIINVVSRRFPICEIVLSSAGVQGESAASELIEALDKVYEKADFIDTVIIGRGGGSANDLNAFNDEALARKIYNSPIPVISAVGHETDFTICDLVADLRVPTPSAAAEIAVPDKEEIINRINSARSSCINSLKNKSELSKAKLNAVCSLPVLKKRTHFIDEKSIMIDSVIDKINSLLNAKFEKEATRFGGIISILDALNPLKIMNRGFVYATIDNKSLSSVEQAKIGDTVTLKVTDGSIDCSVLSKEKKYDI